MDMMKIFDNEIIKTLAHIIGVILFYILCFCINGCKWKRLSKSSGK